MGTVSCCDPDQAGKFVAWLPAELMPWRPFQLWSPEAGRRAHAPRHRMFGRFNLAGRPACHVQAPCRPRRDQSTAVSGLSGNVPQAHRHWCQTGCCRLAPSRAGTPVSTASSVLKTAHYLNSDTFPDLAHKPGKVAVHCDQADWSWLRAVRQDGRKYLLIPLSRGNFLSALALSTSAILASSLSLFALTRRF